ncbi:MAG TPA: hypothetical protein VMU59_07510, partial [Caulobacteraceae bacterium]|nr:hypothetical protein [Caulobacteraceae bacterium]
MASHVTRTLLATAAMIGLAFAAQAQQPPAAGGPGGGGGPGVGGRNFAPSQTDLYRSDFVKLDGATNDGLLYEPVKPGANPHVAIVTTYAPPAAELASRGYRVVLVKNAAQNSATPFTDFGVISNGIAYARKLAGIDHVAVLAWGGGATAMILYADVAANGPSACQGAKILSPC